MNKRRSNLNGRFYTPGSPALDKATRRNYVMNGASVLIEYSPSIFTTATMPPGAEEFMTALEVYRR